MPRHKQSAPQRREDAGDVPSGPLDGPSRLGMVGQACLSQSDAPLSGSSQAIEPNIDGEEEVMDHEDVINVSHTVIDLICDDEEEEEEEEEVVEVEVQRPRKRRKKGPVYGKDFESFLANSSVYVEIDVSPNDLEYEASGDRGLFGQFKLRKDPDVFLEVGEELYSEYELDLNSIKSNKLYLYIGDDSKSFRIYYETKDGKTAINFPVSLCMDEISPPGLPITLESFAALKCKGIKSSKYFTLTLPSNHLVQLIHGRSSSSGNFAAVKIWLNFNSFHHLKYASESPHRFPNENLLNLVAAAYRGRTPFAKDIQEPPTRCIDEVYRMVSSKIGARSSALSSNDSEITQEIQHSSLKPTLRPFQVNAVKWMLARESENMSKSSSPNPLFRQIELIDGTKVVFNQYGGFFVNNLLDQLKLLENSTGGILADEMGLGKTVEVLSLILNHPPKDYDGIKPPSILTNLEIDSRMSCMCGSDDFEFLYTGDIEVDQVLCDHCEEVALNEDLGRGRRRSRVRRTAIECVRCGLLQHVSCVNFCLSKWSQMPYLCGHCWNSEDVTPISSKATMIISPTSISHQWLEEITRHINSDSLNIINYHGVATKYVQPYDMAEADLVLTTYETLCKEINYVNIHNGKEKFRNPKRFNANPTPLFGVTWWRICLDEAQMIENPTAKTAEMVLNLNAVHRWCVSGTPIQRSLHDLYGLLLFIAEDPYWNRTWFDEMLYKPYCCGIYEPLVDCLNVCFWRSSKRDVESQLGIPPQHQKMHTLELNQIERHFYMRTHEDCAKNFLDKLMDYPDFNIRLKDLDKRSAASLLYPLLRLRQACDHPQVVRGRFLPITKKTMTMEELLESMINSNQRDCEDVHRKLLNALHGQAGVYIIQEKFVEAIETYRKALKSVADHEEKKLFRTDKLQKLHALHNLAEILELCGIKQVTGPPEDSSSSTDSGISVDSSSSSQSGSPSESQQRILDQIGRTLEDEKLKLKAEEIKNEYLAKGKSTVVTAIQEQKLASQQAKEVRDAGSFLGQRPWWNRAIDRLIRRGDATEFVERVKEELEDRYFKQAERGFLSITTRFREASGLVYILFSWAEELEKTHAQLKKEVESLSPTPTDEQVNEAIDCHLRPVLDKHGKRVAKNFKQCHYCKMHELFNKYEALLFRFSQDEKDKEAADKLDALTSKLRRGTWAHSEHEQVYKVLLSFLRSKGYDEGDCAEWIEEGKSHLKYLEVLKKEFRGLRGVWSSIYDFAAQIDEIKMAMIRLQLRYEDDIAPKDAPYLIAPHEVEHQLLKLQCEEQMERGNLRRKLAHLQYLKTLQEATSSEDGKVEKVNECPICKDPLDTKWCVLECGHYCCMTCCDQLLHDEVEVIPQSRIKDKAMKCFICRQFTKLEDMHYVDLTAKKQDERVKGSWSTKVEAIVRCLLEMRETDCDAKAIVFSTWQDVLSLISKACTENGIRHVTTKDSKGFVTAISEFKNNPQIAAILMPFHSGAKGLNLIEATHVILSEPILNPGIEKQAIGRIHRIGQTRETYVHRFIVKQTIEEKIFEMYSPSGHAQTSITKDQLMGDSCESGNITLEEMRRLFTDDMILSSMAIDDNISETSESSFDEIDEDEEGEADDSEEIGDVDAEDENDMSDNEGSVAEGDPELHEII